MTPMHVSSRWALLVAAVATVVGLVLAPAASAAPPADVGTQQIDDQAGVGADTSAARDALQTLWSDRQVRLYVVLVDSFDGTPKEDWAQQSFTRSDLGGNDVLLAIATQDRRFGGWVADAFPLSKDQVGSIISTDAAPHLANNDYSGAIVAAAQGLDRALGNTGGAAGGTGSSEPSHGSLGWIWFVVILAVAVIGFLWYRAAKRKKAAEAKAAKDAGPPPEPYEQLSNRSVNALIQTDNAVRASESELQLAEADFGSEATAEFRAVHDDAKAKLTQAFQRRQEIDDEIPESEDIRRGWMAEIIDLCQQASDALEAQTEKFERLQNLKARLPEVLSALPGRIDEQAARLPKAAATLQRLGQAYSDTALETVESNTDQANERLEFARTSLGEAQEAASGTDTGTAVLAARAAQEAIGQAATLLDAIDRIDADLASAATQLAAARRHVGAELADAKAALAEGQAGAATDELQGRLDEVAATLAEAATAEAGRNPVSTLKKLTDADHALDDILAATRTAQKQQARARAALQNELVTAESTVSAVDDFISTRRGAMNSVARTRLAEAKRHLQQARDLADTDSQHALSEARRATDLARQAYQEARRDMDDWYGGPGRRPMMGGVGGAMLGGIVLGSLLGGHRGGGWGGGFGGYGGGFGGGMGGGGGFGGGFGGGGGGFGGSF